MTDGTPVYTHLLAPKPLHYVAQVRGPGCRKWREVCECQSEQEAARAMLEAFMEQCYVKRGRVIACYEWYEPSLCLKVER